MAEYKDITILKEQISDFKKSINSPNSDYMTGYLSALSATEGIIAMLPTADVVEVKHGRWMVPSCEIKIFEDKYVICSECNVMIPVIKELDMYYFCPRCGAKMDG